MKRTLYSIVLLLIVLTIPRQGRTQAGSTKVTIKVIQVYQGQDADRGTPNEYRWNFTYKNSPTYCLKKSSRDQGWFHDVRTIVDRKSERFVPGYNTTTYQPISITMESWEDDKGDECTYDTDDDIHYGPNSTITKYDLYDEQPPGTTKVATMRKAFTYNIFNRVTYEFFYTTPEPSRPQISGNPAYVCVNKAITLNTNSYVSPTFRSQVKLYWEYNIEGDNIILPVVGSVPLWRSLGSATTASVNNGKKSVTLSSLTGLGKLTKRTKVRVRVRAYSNGSYSTYSNERTIEVDPPGPVFTATATRPSCATKATGKIKLAVSNGTGNYKGLLYRNGSLDTVKYDFSGASYTLTTKPGTYKIRLVNKRSGAAILSTCDITRTVKVGTVAGISWHSDTKRTNSNCPGGKGSINVRVSGGISSERIRFSISPGSGSFTQSGSHQGKYTGLPAGSYTVTANDPCSGKSITRKLTITAPQKVFATTTKTQPTCSNPHNGKIKVNASGGSGKYDYELWKGSKKIKARLNTTSKSHTFSKLSAGTYVVKVYDNIRRSCGLVEETISLSFTALSVKSAVVEHISCADETGKVTIRGSGGSGTYSYTLAHSSGKYTQTNTNGNFTVNQGGSYTITLKNSGISCNNAASRTISVKEPPPLSLTISQQAITCSGVYNGELQATITGGTAPYTYRWQERENTTEAWYNFAGTGLGTTTISRLYDARYRLIVTDANGCSLTSEEYVMTDPDELTLENISVTQVSCQGADDARIVPVASGGWGGYTFQYQQEGEAGYLPFTENTLFTPGTYYIQVTDQEGCVAAYSEKVILNEPSEPLSFTYQVSDYDGYALSCFDGSDGWVQAVPTGGNSHSFGNSYQYALNGGTFTTNPHFTGLARGTYQLSVQDERGCVITQSVILTAPEELTLVTEEKNYIQCYGDSTGYINVLAGGGVPPYNYRLGTGGWQTEASFANLPAGNYAITVEDSRGCQTLHHETIATNDSLAITFDKTDVQCYGLNNGTITASGSGGKRPYQFSWKQPDRRAINSSDATISELAPGWYTLTLTDNEGCTLVDSVLIEEPAGPLLSVPMITPVRCFGEDNGQIALPTGGGTPPYRYSLDGGATFQDDSLFVDLASGTYPTLIVDSRGCTFTKESTIVEPASLAITLVSQTDILCHGNATGSLQVVATGGTEPYRYSNGVVWQSSGEFTDLSAGVHTITVQDDRGCEATLSTTLIEPDTPLQLDYTVVPVQCKGSATGTIQTSVQGGSAPYTFEWVGLSATTETVINLPAGHYELITTDAHNCQLVDTITVSEPKATLQGDINTQQNASCFGLTDGAVEVVAAGGYPPYQYSWQGGPLSPTQNFADLAKGSYQVIIQDSMDCQVTVDISITQPDTLIAIPQILQQVQCKNNSDAQFQATVTGGTQPYQYSLDDGVTWQGEALFSGYPIGTYTILARDSLGCQASTSLTITEPEVLSIKLSNVVAAACNQANGEAEVKALGGTLPYRYAWVNQQDELISEEAYPTNLKADIYNVTVTDANGCQVHATQIINDLDGPVSEITAQQGATCFTSADGSATVAASGGSGDYEYQWTDSLAQTTATAAGLAQGEYFVTVTDKRGCVSISSVIINSPEAIRLDTLQWQAPSCYEACDGVIEFAVSGGVAPYTYHWADRSETGLLLTDLCQGKYTLTVTDAIGCILTQVLKLPPPDSLQLSIAQNQIPTCYQDCDGLAAIIVEGGTPPYQYQWNDDAKQTTSQAEGLCAGTYTVQVTDAQGCQKQQQITIEEAPRIPINLPDTVTLCLDQSVDLDVTVPLGRYNWTRDGEAYSEEGRLTLEQAGLYQVVVTNEPGCQRIAQTRILSYDTLFDVNFLQTTELYTGDTLTLTEVCFPLPDSVSWRYASGAKLLTDSGWEPQITFEDAGTYEVTLIGYYSVCTDSITKTVAFFPPQEVLPSNGRAIEGPQGIETIEIYPNPTTGIFRVDVTLYSETALFAFLNDAQGQQITRRKQQGGSTYTLEFNIHNYASGQYYLRLMTEYDKKVVKIILQ